MKLLLGVASWLLSPDLKPSGSLFVGQYLGTAALQVGGTCVVTFCSVKLPTLLKYSQDCSIWPDPTILINTILIHTVALGKSSTVFCSMMPLLAGTHHSSFPPPNPWPWPSSRASPPAPFPPSAVPLILSHGTLSPHACTPQQRSDLVHPTWATRGGAGAPPPEGGAERGKGGGAGHLSC